MESYPMANPKWQDKGLIMLPTFWSIDFLLYNGSPFVVRFLLYIYSSKKHYVLLSMDGNAYTCSIGKFSPMPITLRRKTSKVVHAPQRIMPKRPFLHVLFRLQNKSLHARNPTTIYQTFIPLYGQARILNFHSFLSIVLSFVRDIYYT